MSSTAAPEWLERVKANDPLLTTLELENVGLGAEGARTLGAALERNTTLSSINLRRSLQYGLGVLATTFAFVAHNLGIVRLRRFDAAGHNVHQHYDAKYASDAKYRSSSRS